MNASAVLIIDDSQVALNQFRDILEEAGLFGKIYLAASAEEGLAVAMSRPLDMILCDVLMPGLDGFNFLALRNEKEQLREVPVIMITSDDQPDSKIRGLDLGACDYITKPFNPEELLARIKVHLKIKSLQDRLLQHHRMLDEHSRTDLLTGLSNRRGVMEVLEREFRRGLRKQAPLAVVMGDIDHFQSVNDSFGHQQGDTVLVAVADLLRRHLRPYDLAGRFGGEEFLLVLPDTSLDQARQLAERIRSAQGRLGFPPPLQDLRLTISLGVAASPDGKVLTVDDLIREAECALFRAKRDGRNRVEAMPQ